MVVAGTAVTVCVVLYLHIVLKGNLKKRKHMHIKSKLGLATQLKTYFQAKDF